MSNEIEEIKTVPEYETRELLNNRILHQIKNQFVAQAFLNLDRKEFVPEDHKDEAYEDRAINTTESSSISQPTLVGAMLEALEVQGGEKVFELGTATGFEASWLALMGCDVFTMDNNVEHCISAKKNMDRLGIKNVNVYTGDGSYGLPDHAPFDAMVISAAFRVVPQQLIDQLKEGGIIVMPLGKDPDCQKLIKGKKVNGEMVYETLGDEVWFHKVFTDIPGGWTQELLDRSRQLKIDYIRMVLNALPPEKKVELLDHLSAARQEYPENQSFTWENYPEYLSKAKQMTDAFFSDYLNI